MKCRMFGFEFDENKLEKVRISQTYSDEVEEGFVISFDLKGIEKDIQDMTDSAIKDIDEIVKKKEAEVLEV